MVTRVAQVTFPWGAALVVALLAIGCSSAGPAAPKCDPARCAAGSQCIDDGSGAGPACLRVCTRQSQCPYGSFCNDAQPTSWCEGTTTGIVDKQSGQWGAPCLPSGGEMNAACDSTNGFRCYGTSPTDANAFCTYYNCSYDSDCAGGWYCAEVNTGPNVESANRTFGETRFWCLPRTYCSRCARDHDCPLAADGTQQHCATDAMGNGFCTPQCSGNDSCPLDAACTPSPWGLCGQATCQSDADCQGGAAPEQCVGGLCQAPCTADADCPKSNGMAQRCVSGVCVTQACASDDDCPPSPVGFYQHCNAGACAPECGSGSDCDPGVQACQPFSVCTPRAGTCAGDGSLCSPCRSDYDCVSAGLGGYCLEATYSGERFCSQAAAQGTTCTSGGTIPAGACPMGAALASAVSCTTGASDFAPQNQCLGLVSFAGQLVPGCWTPAR